MVCFCQKENLFKVRTAVRAQIYPNLLFNDIPSNCLNSCMILYVLHFINHLSIGWPDINYKNSKIKD